jgi:hypothetical protein
MVAAQVARRLPTTFEKIANMVVVDMQVEVKVEATQIRLGLPLAV